MSRDELTELIARTWAGCDEVMWSRLSTRFRDSFRRRARILLEDIDQAGFVIVPREPTEAMKKAGGLAFNDDETVLAVTGQEALLAYRAMIEASPLQEKGL